MFVFCCRFIHFVARLRHPAKRYSCFAIAFLLTLFKRTSPVQFFCIGMNGNSFGCSVKAFYDFARERLGDEKFVWAFGPSIYDKIYLKRKVKLYTIEYYMSLLKSKVIVSDQRFTKELLPYKRKSQVYIQFWHGTALKKIEADIPNLSKRYKKRSIWDSSKIDLFFSGSTYMTNLYKTVFWYNGPVFETGTPRNDIFFHDCDVLKKNIHSALGIPLGKKIALYAPTFRDNLSVQCYKFDSELFINLLQKKFGGEWVLVIKLHPNLLNKKGVLKQIQKMFPQAINASTYVDMQELLAVTDCLMTDYSSTMFDFAYSNKPCFLFSPDMETYDRGYYTEIRDKIPFDVFFDSESMCNVIQSFDENLYKEKIKQFFSFIGDKETGNASEKVYNQLQSLLKG